MSQRRWVVQTKIEDKWSNVSNQEGTPYFLDTMDEAYSLSYIRYPELWQQQKQDGQKYIRIKEIKNTTA
jgi:hypothetical protein